MHLIHDFRKEKPTFDSLTDRRYFDKIKINDDIIEVNYNSIIDTQFTGGNVDENSYEYYKKLLNLGTFAKAPCGGFVNFYKIKSLKKREFILFSGVNEVSNSRYIVIIHKII